uniref:Uncharacterized protein n=1 Tax=Haliea sp. ETY-M TaxID=1055105 RepID=A0A455R563_9GAMM|nr:hypothetical protein [Haliea sp. ETY-M]
MGQLSSLYDSLATLHDTPDPSRTKESRALRYKQQHETATKKATQLLERATANREQLIQDARAAAYERTGLNQTLPHAEAQEMRAALRELSEEDRTKALQRASQAGDAKLLKAVLDAPSPVLIGPISMPLNTMVDVMLDNAAPDHRQDIQDAESAFTHFEIALEAFTTSTEGMRDPLLEAAAEQQQEAITKAERDLDSGGLESAAA